MCSIVLVPQKPGQDCAHSADCAISGHQIVTLIGVVSAGEPLMLVMELCGRGNLAEYLRASFNRLDLSLASKLRMVRQL